MNKDLKKIKKPMNLLLLFENQEIIGTAADEEINIVNDYDLQEYANYANIEGKSNLELYTNMYEEFKEKFLDAKRNKNIFITDFKCGHYKSIPIRWNFENMMDGYKVVEDKKIWFINALQQKSVIKLDLLYLDEDKRLYEITQNYYLEINKNTTYNKIMKTDLKASLIKSFKEYYYNDKNFYKALKRIYSYYKIFDKNNKNIKLLRELFNSELGKQSKIISDLKNILLLMEQTFRNVPKNIIYDNLLLLNFNIFDNDIITLYNEIIQNFKSLSKNMIREKIENIINLLFDVVNEKTLKYIEKNNILKNLL